MKQSDRFDLSNGSSLSKLTAFLSAAFLLVIVFGIIRMNFRLILVGVFGDLVFMWISYASAGGLRNPELIKQLALDYNGDVLNIPGVYWEDKIDFFFSGLLREARGNHSAALGALTIENCPGSVAQALQHARELPNARTWKSLVDLVKRHPPKGHMRL